MSRSANDSPPPQEPAWDDRSTVRPRPPELRRHGVSRIEYKVRLALILESSLSPEDPRARLLRLAMMRRDEPLLDSLLDALRKERSCPNASEG